MSKDKNLREALNKINQDSFLVGRALGLAEGGWWNDALDVIKENERLFKPVLDALQVWNDSNGKNNPMGFRTVNDKSYMDVPLIKLAKSLGLKVKEY